MSFHSLKFKIAWNLAIIILISVLFSDLIIVSVIQKSMIRDRATKSREYLSDLSKTLKYPLNSGLQSPEIQIRSGIHDPVIDYMDICFENGQTYHFGQVDGDLQKWIDKIEVQTIQEGRGQTEYVGETLGVFGQQKKYLLITEPGYFSGRDEICINVMAVRLDDIYAVLRDSQKILIFYVIANFSILLLFGIYRLSRLVIRPIHRFIKMTDDFREKDRQYFTHGKNYQEFNQLSKALNHMLDLIETDKQNLRQSLDDLERANRELKNAQNEILKAEKLASVGRLSAGIAHEIGNPIGIILGYLDLLNARPGLKGDEAANDYLSRMQREINRIHQIIRQLLDFSRISSEGARIVSVHHLVRDVVSMMSVQPLMRDIKIDFQAGDISDAIFIEKDRMRQVLINLIINAADSIQASGQEKQGEIRIRSELIHGKESAALNHQATFLLKVMDNGAGIPDENINYIFDPFFTTKPPGKGTGLGLSVSYLIIEEAGGKMVVESIIDQGTSMLIYLPLYQGAEIPGRNIG